MAPLWGLSLSLSLLNAPSHSLSTHIISTDQTESKSEFCLWLLLRGFGFFSSFFPPVFYFFPLFFFLNQPKVTAVSGNNNEAAKSGHRMNEMDLNWIEWLRFGKRNFRGWGNSVTNISYSHRVGNPTRWSQSIGQVLWVYLKNYRRYIRNLRHFTFFM